MADPWSRGLYEPDVASFVDDDRFVVLGVPMGPAGVSSVELPDGSRWEVDHLDPAQLVALDVPGVDPASSALLVAAFGGDGALMITESAGTAGEAAHHERMLRPWGRPGRAPQSKPRVQPPAHEAGELVVATDLAADRRLHPLARIAAAAELAARAGRVPAGELLGVVAPRVLEGADRLAELIDDAELASLDPRLAAELSGVCLRAGKLRGVDSPLLHLGDRARRFGGGRSDDRSTRRRRPAAARIADADLDVAVARSDALASAPAEMRAAAPPPRARRVGPGLVRVLAPGADPDRWVRVLRRDGLVLLGQAPVRSDGTAEVAVPPDAGDDELVVQVVGAGDLQVLAGRPAEIVRAAVRAGRDAARASRLRDFGVAAARWSRCAVLWEQAGDEERSWEARSLAQTGGQWLRVRPHLADALAEALADRR